MSDYPLRVFAASFLLLLLSVWVGANVIRRKLQPEERLQEDYTIILGAALTLVGLIIGFSFSMAISRYDQRKNLEEAEANAISTEYVRADLLTAADAVRVRGLLRNYFDQRVIFYTARDEQQLRQSSNRTEQIQAELWSAVVVPASASLVPSVTLAVAGMNDVLNSQGYTQAAWSNRIPTAAWYLMVAIAVCCHLLIGYGARDGKAKHFLMMVLPLVMSISFLLIADIDTPRHGVIRVKPVNLLSIAESLRAP